MSVTSNMVKSMQSNWNKNRCCLPTAVVDGYINFNYVNYKFQLDANTQTSYSLVIMNASLLCVRYGMQCPN